MRTPLLKKIMIPLASSPLDPESKPLLPTNTPNVAEILTGKSPIVNYETVSKDKHASIALCTNSMLEG